MGASGKINIFILNLYTEIGGGEQMLLNLLKEIDRDKFEPTMGFNGDGPFVERVEELGIDVVRLHYPTVMLKRLVRPGVIREVLAASRELEGYLRAHRPDVIHCGDVLSLILLARSIRRLRIPVAYSMIFSYEWTRTLLFTLLGAILVKKIVVPSGFVPVPAFLQPKTETIPPGVDTARFRPIAKGEKNTLREELKIGGRTRLIGMAARFDPAKGHLLFLQTAAKLVTRRKDLKFVIAGDVTNRSDNSALEESKMRALSFRHDAGLENDVVLLGHREDIEGVIRSLDVAVIPSETEGYSLVVLEALASGVAVVTSPRVGVLERVRDLPGVFVAGRREAESFAVKLEEALAFMDGHGGNTLLPESVSEELSWKRCTRAFEKCYAEVSRVSRPTP